MNDLAHDLIFVTGAVFYIGCGLVFIWWLLTQRND